MTGPMMTPEELRVEISKSFDSKADAVAFAVALLQVPQELLSPSFQIAMEACRRYDVSAQDLLEYKREKARRK